MSIRALIICMTAALLGVSNSLCAQTEGYDVFIPIAKYMRQGDAESLSAWFDDNLEISIMSNTSDSSRNQARQVLKSFFENHPPRDFNIIHTAGRFNMKYALGRLNAGGETFEVTIFVGFRKESYRIQQLKILRDN